MRGMWKQVLVVLGILVAQQALADDVTSLGAAQCPAQAKLLAQSYLTSEAGYLTLGLRVRRSDIVDILTFGPDLSTDAPAMGRTDYQADIMIRFSRTQARATEGRPNEDRLVRFFYSGSSTCENLRIVRFLALGGVDRDH